MSGAGFALLAAVDIAGGEASQVVGETATRDPKRVAEMWIEAGAQWLHVADLDRAFDRGDNDADLYGVLTHVGRRAQVQISGGVVDEGRVRDLLDAGAARVVLSSAVLADPAATQRLVAIDPYRVALGVDVRDDHVVVRGRDQVIGRVAQVLAATPRSARWAVVADASRDGSRQGVDSSLFARVGTLLPGETIASGGVRDLDDVRELRAATTVSGVVLGAALHHGSFTLAEAIRAVSTVGADRVGDRQ